MDMSVVKNGMLPKIVLIMAVKLPPLKSKSYKRFPEQGRNIVLLGIRPYLRTLCSTTWASHYLWGQSAATGHAVAEQKLEIAGTRPVTTKAKITK